MSENSQDAAVPVIGNFSFTLPAPNGATLSISGYVYGNEAKQSLDERMDLCRQSVERQQRLMEIPLLEARLEQLEKAKEDVQRSYVDLLERKKAKAAGREGAKSLSSQDQANLNNSPIQLKGIEAEIEKAHKKIAEARAGV